MATPPPEPMPLILTNASLKINDQELACVTNHLELSPDVSLTTLDTFCGSKDYPGVVKWSLVATLYQSFDPAATEEVLSQALEAYRTNGDLATFSIAGYRDRAPGTTDNPTWTGEVIPQPYSPINGDAGDASTVEMEWSVVGEPVRAPVVTLPGP